MTKTPSRVRKGVAEGGQFAADLHAEPNVSLAAAAKPKKTSSKGVQTRVTLPDGTVAQRTSVRGNYTHAVVMSPEIPELVIANREARIREAKTKIENIDKALESPVFKKRQRFRDGRDPDLNYRGEPTYHGFEAMMYTSDGVLVRQDRCNSKNISQGQYDENGEYDVHALAPVSQTMKAAVKIEKANTLERIAQYEADIEAVKAGTYDLGGPSVVRWSSREDLAAKAASSEFKHSGATRRATVVPVDED